MRTIVGYIALFALIAFICSPFFPEFCNAMAWFFLFKNTMPETSLVGGIIVRILTIAVSYGLVGVIFTAFRFFNSKIMSLVYLIISTFVEYLAINLVMSIEQHIVVIGIVLGIVTILIIAFFVVLLVLRHLKKKKEEQKEENLSND